MANRFTVPGPPKPVYWLLMLALIGSLGCQKNYQEMAEAAPLLSLGVQDDLGQAVPLFQHPRRIVVLSPGLVETLVALNARQKIVGVSEWCIGIPEIKGLPQIPMTPSVADHLQVLIRLKPDAVLAIANDLEHPEKLRDFLAGYQIPVFYQQVHTLEGYQQSIAELGKLLDRRQEAKIYSDRLQTLMRMVEQQVRSQPRVRCAVLTSATPLQTTGSRHLISHLVRRCGGEPVYPPHADGMYVQITGTELQKRDPEALFMLTDEPAPFKADLLDNHQSLRPLAQVPGRFRPLYPYPFLQLGPKLGDGILNLVRRLHPDIDITGIVRAFSNEVETEAEAQVEEQQPAPETAPTP